CRRESRWRSRAGLRAVLFNVGGGCAERVGCHSCFVGCEFVAVEFDAAGFGVDVEPSVPGIGWVGICGDGDNPFRVGGVLPNRYDGRFVLRVDVLSVDFGAGGAVFAAGPAVVGVAAESCGAEFVQVAAPVEGAVESPQSVVVGVEEFHDPAGEICFGGGGLGVPVSGPLVHQPRGEVAHDWLLSLSAGRSMSSTTASMSGILNRASSASLLMTRSASASVSSAEVVISSSRLVR